MAIDVKRSQTVTKGMDNETMLINTLQGQVLTHKEYALK